MGGARGGGGGAGLMGVTAAATRQLEVASTRVKEGAAHQ